jgi:hypothetical protein
MVFFAVTRPSWEWDIIPYTMIVLKGGVADVATAHAKAYALIEAYVPASVFAELKSNMPNNQMHHANPGALASYLPSGNASWATYCSSRRSRRSPIRSSP